MHKSVVLFAISFQHAPLSGIMNKCIYLKEINMHQFCTKHAKPITLLLMKKYHKNATAASLLNYKNKKIY